jgi:hypothetical protein
MLVQNIEFKVNETIAHGYVGDRNSGQVFIVVVSGETVAELRAQLDEHLTEITQHVRDEGGEPNWVSLGSDPANPPGDISTWP